MSVHRKKVKIQDVIVHRRQLKKTIIEKPSLGEVTLVALMESNLNEYGSTMLAIKI